LLRTCCGGTAAVPGTVQLLQGTRPIAGAVTLSNDGLSLVFAPTKPLSSSTTYTVVVTGVKGASGIQMTASFQSLVYHWPDHEFDNRQRRADQPCERSYRCTHQRSFHGGVQQAG
jgi:hypothetical protein